MFLLTLHMTSKPHTVFLGVRLYFSSRLANHRLDCNFAQYYQLYFEIKPKNLQSPPWVHLVQYYVYGHLLLNSVKILSSNASTILIYINFVNYITRSMVAINYFFLLLFIPFSCTKQYILRHNCLFFPQNNMTTNISQLLSKVQ